LNLNDKVLIDMKESDKNLDNFGKIATSTE